MKKIKKLWIFGSISVLLVILGVYLANYSWKIGYWRKVAQLQKQIQENPQNVQLLLQVGKLHANSGNPDRAIENFQKILKIDENNAEAIARLGDVETRIAGKVRDLEEKMEWSQKGLLHLDGAVEKFPEQYIVYLVRGTNGVYWPDMFQRHKTSISDLSHLLQMKEKNQEIFPDDLLPEIYYHLGLAYEKDGDFTQAKINWGKISKQSTSSYYTKMAEKKFRRLKKQGQ